VPWAEPRSRFTLLMERLIIDLIRQCSTVTGACRIARISWDEAWGVMERAVIRGRARKQARPMPYIGVDEKAFRKGDTLRDSQPFGSGRGAVYESR
jgi:transposase